MTEKHYDSDWAKAKSRDLVRDMIQRTLLRFRKPKDLRVLCFPGRDAKEIHQVYDSLGIPRQNIVGIERDKAYAKEAAQNAPGIQVINQDLEDYVQNIDSFNFDVVSLDYTGPTSGKNIMHLRKTFLQSTKNHIMLHQANLMKRDHKFYPLYGLMNAIGDDSGLPDLGKVKLGQSYDALNQVKRDFMNKAENGLDISHEKNLGYTGALFGAMASAHTDLSKIAEYILMAYSPKIFSRIISEAERKYGIPSLSNLSVRDTCNVVDLLNEVFPKLCNQNELSEELLQKNLYKILTLVSLEGRPYYARNGVKYSYISESGAPMIGDIHFTSFPEKAINKAWKAANYLGYPSRFSAADPYELRKLVADFSKEWSREDNIKIYNQDRIFLGNSSRPVLSKKRFIEELEAGKTVDEIKSIYRGWDKKPLAQWKAHYTMGTYSSQRMSEEADEDSDLERITKEDAIDLLSSGIPTEEVHAAYPTSFTLPQLRAYKAHITMNTYKEENNPIRAK